QAEDGIRDFHVTGVQTCALPICHGSYSRTPYPFAFNNHQCQSKLRVSPEAIRCRWSATTCCSCSRFSDSRKTFSPPSTALKRQKIGRASCRERVAAAADAGARGE